MKKISQLTFLFLFVGAATAFAQGEKQTIRFSGLVVEGDSMSPIVGAHVYLPKIGKGTITNPYGYFSLQVRPGDLVIISSITYEPQEILIPPTSEPNYSLLIDLKKDTTILEEIVIYPYPDEEAFKEAFLAMNTLTIEEENLRRNLDPERIREYAYRAPMGATANYTYAMDQQINAITNRFTIPTTQYLNPIAWAKFIKDVRAGKYKKRKKK